MKKLALVSLLALSGAAFATGPTPSSGGPAHVVINGQSIQTAVFEGSTVSNKSADDDAFAKQNVSSNSGNVTVNGQSIQTTLLKSSTLSNKAGTDNAVATQDRKSVV